MVVFKQKNIIATKSLQEDLAEARVELNLTLLSVEKKIGIGREYLEAIEAGEWQKLPGCVYAKNFLKRYAIFLGLDEKRILKKFIEETGKQIFWENKVEEIRFGIVPGQFLSWPRILKNMAMAAGALVVVVYLSVQVWFLLKPPSLKVLYPAENFVSQSGLAKILGQVESESTVGVNGREVAVDKAGFFTIDINLNKGLNVIKLEAKKKNGRTTIVYRTMMVEEKPALTSQLDN